MPSNSQGYIFDKTSPTQDNIVILNTRQALVQPFQATDWLDLRIGFFLSVCGATVGADDDVITGLAEEIGTPPDPLLPWNDRVAIGITDSATGTVFLGYTNVGGNRQSTTGTTKLVSSDSALGTTTSDYWRWQLNLNANWQLRILDNFIVRATSTDGSQMHLVQNFSGGHAPGYATLVALRFQRDNTQGRSKVISMSVKCDAVNHTGDILYTNTPTATVMDTNLEAFPTQVQVMGPVELSQEPDTLFVYWPFSNSRLRISAIGILKFA